jgi:hypothetical protein
MMTSTDANPAGASAGRRVAVLQSGYLPWKGYFDIIHDVDLFVFYDDVQYTKQDWRNRNRIKTPYGVRWLTVPVRRQSTRICDAEISGSSWAASHWRRLEASYRGAPFFAYYRPFFEPLFLHRQWTRLSELNQHLIRAIARELLGIETTFADSRDYAPSGRRLDRLIELLGRAGAHTYLSGPSARSYIDPQRFEAAGIELVWKDYAGYPEYPQLHPPFVHEVSIVDLLFHLGPRAPFQVWGWRVGALAER